MTRDEFKRWRAELQRADELDAAAGYRAKLREAREESGNE